MAHRPYGSVQNRMYPSALYCAGVSHRAFFVKVRSTAWKYLQDVVHLAGYRLAFFDGICYDTGYCAAAR